MADGTRKPIKDVKLGDWVMAKNPVTGLAAPRQVIDLIRHSGPHTMVKIRLADGTIIDATDHHPFWVKTHGVNGRWTDAIDLAAGDVLLTSAGATETVAGVSINEQDLTAYNLTVDELHTYYVSGDDVLVHNATCPFGAVAGPNGEMLPLPKGATGTRSATGKGWTYDIPKGTEGLDPRVTQVRLMDPVLKGIHQYPNGYVVYMNKADQSVNPLTGQTLSKADPYNHLPLPPP